MSLDAFSSPNLSGIPSDWVPLTPYDNNDDTGDACTGLYITGAGTVAFETAASKAAGLDSSNDPAENP